MTKTIHLIRRSRSKRRRNWRNPEGTEGFDFLCDYSLRALWSIPESAKHLWVHVSDRPRRGFHLVRVSVSSGGDFIGFIYVGGTDEEHEEGLMTDAISWLQNNFEPITPSEKCGPQEDFVRRLWVQFEYE